jgi:hypothetical protein
MTMGREGGGGEEYNRECLFDDNHYDNKYNDNYEHNNAEDGKWLHG